MAEFLAVAEAGLAKFGPTPGFEKKTFDSSGLPTEGTSISAPPTQAFGSKRYLFVVRSDVPTTARQPEGASYRS